jgi:hypothetical protein
VTVVRNPNDLAEARDERRDKGQCLHPLLDHRAHQPRRIRIEEEGQRQDQRIYRDLPGVVGDQQGPTRRHILDAVNLRSEVASVHERRRHRTVAGEIGVQAERVVAESRIVVANVLRTLLKIITQGVRPQIAHHAARLLRERPNALPLPAGLKRDASECRHEGSIYSRPSRASTRFPHQTPALPSGKAHIVTKCCILHR